MDGENPTITWHSVITSVECAREHSLTKVILAEHILALECLIIILSSFIKISLKIHFTIKELISCSVIFLPCSSIFSQTCLVGFGGGLFGFLEFLLLCILSYFEVPFSFLPPVCPIFYCLCFGASSTKRVSSWRLSGSRKYLILLPLMVRWSNAIVSLPFTVSLTAFKWVFIDTSTPIKSFRDDQMWFKDWKLMKMIMETIIDSCSRNIDKLLTGDGSYYNSTVL